MKLYRVTHDLSAPVPPDAEEPRRLVGPVALFIGAVLIAGLTCILYLWQQSQIVAGTQEIAQYNRTLTLLYQQEGDLLSQKQQLTSVTKVVAQANKLGMIQGDARSLVALAPTVEHNSVSVAQSVKDHQQNGYLPATNAAMTTWWQGAWDSLYNLVQ